MTAREHLDALFPDGITVTEEDAEALVAAAKEGAKNLPDKDYKANKKALQKAIATNEKEKEVVAIIKFAFDLGLTLKKKLS